MLSEFDLRRNIPPPEGSELTPEEKARRGIIEYIKDVNVKSTRWQAFEHYVHLERAMTDIYLLEGDARFYIHKDQQLRDRIFRGSKYRREYHEIHTLGAKYNHELKRRIPNFKERQTTFYDTLEEIKNQELERRRQPSQPSGLFTRIYERFTR